MSEAAPALADPPVLIRSLRNESWGVVVPDSVRAGTELPSVLRLDPRVEVPVPASFAALLVELEAGSVELVPPTKA